MRRSLLALAPLLAACARPSAAGDLDPSAEVKAIRDEVLATSRAYETVRSLTDEAGPRLSGSPGSKTAIAWAERTLREAGLTHVRAEPVTVPHWERGEESAEMIAPTSQPLSLTALGGSVATPPEGLTGELVEFTSMEALEKADESQLRGKIAFVYLRMERMSSGDDYPRAAAPRGRGAALAAQKGAMALLIRSVGTDESRAPHTGAMRYDDQIPKIPAAALANPDADVIHRLIGQGKRVEVRFKLSARFLPDAQGANVIGEVEGRAAPGEIVLLGAHLDSWDLGRGALDDGAGCAIVIEAARHLAQRTKKPRRTVRVVLFANEENGLRGARAYAKDHAAELDAHVLAMEADLGDGHIMESRFLGPPSATPLFRAVASAASPLGARVSAEPAHGGADLIPLVAAGIPAIDLDPDATTYFDYHHTANDTFERIRKDEIDRAAAAYAAVTWAVAETQGSFGRIPEDKRGR